MSERSSGKTIILSTQPMSNRLLSSLSWWDEPSIKSSFIFCDCSPIFFGQTAVMRFFSEGSDVPYIPSCDHVAFDSFLKFIWFVLHAKPKAIIYISRLLLYKNDFFWGFLLRWVSKLYYIHLDKTPLTNTNNNRYRAMLSNLFQSIVWRIDRPNGVIVGDRDSADQIHARFGRTRTIQIPNTLRYPLRPSYGIPLRGNYIVYVDEALHVERDLPHIEGHLSSRADAFHTRIVDALKYIESQFGLPVIVAGSPKAKVNSILADQFKVFYDVTGALVSNSIVVIGHSSLALLYFNKVSADMILITSNLLSGMKQSSIARTAAIHDAPMLSIDELSRFKAEICRYAIELESRNRSKEFLPGLSKKTIRANAISQLRTKICCEAAHITAGLG